MLLILEIFLILLLFYAFLQDRKELQLSLWIFPCLLFLWVALQWYRLGGYNTLIHGGVNTLLVALCMWVVRSYSMWRTGGFLNTAFGSGDVLFLLVFAWAFPTPVFLVVWIGASLSSILIAKYLGLMKIPYAGYLAFCNALLILVNRFYDLELYKTTL